MLNIDYDKRILGLDILRAFAILTVVYNHGWIYSEKFMSRETYDIFHFDGVSLFFVLSGFLIGGIIFKTIEKNGAGLSSLKDFWIRRWFRTLPLYYLILLFLVIEFAMTIASVRDLYPLLKYFIFLQNFFSLKSGFFLESWSLAVEEWFYIIFPLIVWGMVGILKLELKKITPYIILFFIIGCLAFRFGKFSLYETDLAAGKPLLDRFPFTVICRLDSLMFGILGAYSFKYFNSVWLKYKNSLFYIGLVFIVIDYVFYNYNTFLGNNPELGYKMYRHVFHYLVLPLGVALILPFFYYVKSRFKISRVAIFISIISYSLYLTHLPVVVTLKLPQHLANVLPVFGLYKNILSYLLYWFFSIGISILLYRFYEKPMTDMRERLAKE